MEELVAWFRSQKGVLDTSVMGLGDIPGHGRGAYALQDIPVSRHSRNRYGAELMHR